MPHVLQSGAVPVGAVPLGAVPEEYLRSGFRPYGSAEDLRLSSLPLGLDPGYFRSGYLAYPALSSYRCVFSPLSWCQLMHISETKSVIVYTEHRNIVMNDDRYMPRRLQAFICHTYTLFITHTFVHILKFLLCI